MNNLAAHFACWREFGGNYDPDALPQAESAVAALYVACGRKPPAVIHCRSLYQLLMIPSLTFAILHSDLWLLVSHQLSRHGFGEKWQQHWQEACPDIWRNCGEPILRGMNSTSSVSRDYDYLEQALIDQVLSELGRNLPNNRLETVQSGLKREIYRKFWMNVPSPRFVRDHYVQLEMMLFETFEKFECLPEWGELTAQMKLTREHGRVMTENWQNLVQRLGAEPTLQGSCTLWLSDQLGWLAAAEYLRITLHEKELEKVIE